MRDGEDFALRWFTPLSEVDLCGHATLATAWVLFNLLEADRDTLRFETRSGQLVVRRGEDGLMVMDFPARPAVPRDAPRALVGGLGAEPLEVLASARDYLVVFAAEDDVRKLKPDFARLRGLDRLGIIVSAPGESADFVSRFFAPSVGVPEDPVTGSAHCTLVPYWAARLGRGEAPLEARQISHRGGELTCRLLGDRVTIAGRPLSISPARSRFDAGRRGRCDAGRGSAVYGTMRTEPDGRSANCGGQHGIA